MVKGSARVKPKAVLRSERNKALRYERSNDEPWSKSPDKRTQGIFPLRIHRHRHRHTCTNRNNALMQEPSFDFFLNFCHLSRRLFCLSLQILHEQCWYWLSWKLSLERTTVNAAASSSTFWGLKIIEVKHKKWFMAQKSKSYWEGKNCTPEEMEKT